MSSGLMQAAIAWAGACVHMHACPDRAQKHGCLQLLGQAVSLCSILTDFWPQIAILCRAML